MHARALASVFGALLNRTTVTRWGLLLCACVVAITAGTPAIAQSYQRHRNSAPLTESGLYDLQRDESLGGHTLARHVGRTDAELADRLRREPDISEASTYTDLTTAERTVASAIALNRDRMGAWEARRGRRPNLVLDYTQRGGAPLGRSLARGDRVSRPCESARVVLRWLERERRWVVLTSYPETRR